VASINAFCKSQVSTVEPAPKKVALKIEKKKKHKIGYPKSVDKVCIQRTSGEVVRVSRKEAERLVAISLAKYVPKKVWKAATRG
jgi:hypothetical protein